MAAVGSFFTTPAAADPSKHRPAQQPPDRLKRLQCRAMWGGWRLVQVESAGYAFISLDNEGDRHPFSGFFSEKEAERFLEVRENKNW